MAGKKNDLIKSKERVEKYGDMFTPEHINLRERGFSQRNTGAQAVNYCRTPLQGLCALESIYGVDILPDNVEESKQALLDIFFREVRKIRKI